MTIDSYRFLDFASRQIMKAWAVRETHKAIPFTPLPKPLQECTVALVSTAGVAPIVDLLKKKPWLTINLYSGHIPHVEENSQLGSS